MNAVRASGPLPGIELFDTGEGVPVVFVPGSYSTPSAWRPIQRLLPVSGRWLSNSLCGYGGTLETRTPKDAGMEHEVRVVEAAAQLANRPVHLVGHSFGGTVALAVAMATRIEVASLALFEPNPLALLRNHGERPLHDDALLMSQQFTADTHRGERDAAARVIDYWGGPGTFAGLPPAVQEFCRQAAGTNVLDWLTDFSFEVDADALAALSMPALVVRGELANPAMKAMTRLLAEHMPQARSHVVPGAGHFLISSHPDECAGLLGVQLGRAST